MHNRSGVTLDCPDKTGNDKVHLSSWTVRKPEPESITSAQHMTEPLWPPAQRRGDTVRLCLPSSVTLETSPLLSGQFAYATTPVPTGHVTPVPPSPQ